MISIILRTQIDWFNLVQFYTIKNCFLFKLIKMYAYFNLTRSINAELIQIVKSLIWLKFSDQNETN